MATRRGRSLSVVGSAGLLIGLILLLWPIGVLEAGTVVSLAWDANTELDLAGYRILYGTTSANYTGTIDVGIVTSYAVSGLNANTTYYFAVVAYDQAGNVSGPSNEISTLPTVIVGPLPTVGSAEVLSGSFYIMQTSSETIDVIGSNFQNGATVSLGADISVGPTALLSATELTAPIVVSATASLGDRTLTVINPDGGSGSKVGALKVVKTADINRDCRVDILDLNILARAWNTVSTDVAYTAAADLDNDGQIDGVDLTILIAYLGKPLAVCP